VRLNIGLIVFFRYQVKSLLAALAVLVFATEGRFFYDFLPPLLLVERPYAVDESVATVPLVLVAQDRLQVVPVTDVQIAGYSLTQPLVTLLAPDVSCCGHVRHPEYTTKMSPLKFMDMDCGVLGYDTV
jgi:hypothetical protein